MDGHRVPSPFDHTPTSSAPSIKILHRWRNTLLVLACQSTVCYNDRTQTGGGGLVQILLFFIFIAAVVFFILGLGYGLSSLEEEQSSLPRWRMPREMQHRRKARRHRVRCRFES